MKQIVQYIGYFMAVAGCVAFIWQKAIITEQRRDKATHTEQKIANIEKNMVTKTNIAEIVDSIFVVRLDTVIRNQNALRNSYVAFIRDRYVGKNAPLTFDDFEKYMNGIEFELKIPKPDSADFKIKIRKIN